jgi:hypothetical protein
MPEQNIQVQPQAAQPVTLTTPSKPVSSGPSGGRNQKDRRYMDTFWDTHRHPRRFPNGRPWCGPREIAANRDQVPPPHDGFVLGDLMQGQYVEREDGSIDRPATLMSAWTAPWRPYAKYFKFNYKRKLITFEYARMRMDEEQGVRAYWKAASKMANRIGLVVREGHIPPAQIVDELGEPSQMIRIADAALAGDPWLLGFIDEPNLDLAAILNIPTERGIVSLAPPMPEAMVTQAVKVEAINAAPANVDVLEMLAQMAKNMAAMQEQMLAMQMNTTKRNGASAAQMAKVRAARKATSTSMPAEVAAV